MVLGFSGIVFWRVLGLWWRCCYGFVGLYGWSRFQFKQAMAGLDCCSGCGWLVLRVSFDWAVVWSGFGLVGVSGCMVWQDCGNGVTMVLGLGFG